MEDFFNGIARSFAWKILWPIGLMGVGFAFEALGRLADWLSGF